MQLFFDLPSDAFTLLAQAVPAPETAESLVKQLQATKSSGVGSGILFLCAVQVVVIISYWIASKAVAEENGRLGNALKLWISNFAIYFCIGLVASLITPIVGRMHSMAALIAFISGIVLIVILVWFVVPMKVYEINFLPALAFRLLAFIIYFIGAGAVFVAFAGAQSNIVPVMQKYIALPQSERQKFVTLLSQGGKTMEATPAPVELLPGEADAGDHAKSLQERAVGVRKMYDELRRRQAAMPPNDQAAIAKYQAENARYESLLKQLQAESAAAQARKP